MASVEKIFKFRYFQVLLVENGEEKPFPFSIWAQEMNKRGLLQTCAGSAEKMEVDAVNHKDGIWETRIDVLRDAELPQSADLESGEYLGEDILMIYDEATGIALIQQNRMSLGIVRLRTFLCTTYQEWCKDSANAQVEINGILDTEELDMSSVVSGAVSGAKLSIKNGLDADPEATALFEKIYHEYIVEKCTGDGLVEYERIMPQVRRRYLFRKEKLLLALGQADLCD